MGPSPQLIFDTVNAYQRSAAIKAAIELDIFTGIAEGAETSAELAQKCNASERGVRILCDYLTVAGFLNKQDGRYKLTEDSAVFLNRRSPAYMGSVVDFLQSPMLMEAFKDMTTTVRTGTTIMPDEGTVSAENPIWIKFARSMAPMMMMPAQVMAQIVEIDPNKKVKVLDIAAGHGMYGIALAQRHPNVEVVALDWPGVLEVAKENAQKMGVADRFSTRPGSAFDVEYGNDYDIVLLTNFLHHFDPPTCETLLKKVYGALASDGRAVTVEFVPNEDRVTPSMSAGFSLIMLASTPSGDAYTFSEFQRMFEHAGFKRSELHQLAPAPAQLIISYK
ncbi:MAG: methyltransferase type 12 [Acidobacteria bacterium 13_1_20CM_3_53_8]|nr:MAG: methyltransferase type 12 [Acidobacteria bacterium 13_1_20CM_3_53_8]